MEKVENRKRGRKIGEGGGRKEGIDEKGIKK